MSMTLEAEIEISNESQPSRDSDTCRKPSRLDAADALWIRRVADVNYLKARVAHRQERMRARHSELRCGAARPVAASPPRRRGIADFKNFQPGFPYCKKSKVTGDRDIGCRPASRRPTDAPRPRRITDIQHRESAAVSRDKCVRPAKRHRIRRPTLVPRPTPRGRTGSRSPQIPGATPSASSTPRTERPVANPRMADSEFIRCGSQTQYPQNSRDESKARVSQFRHTIGSDMCERDPTPSGLSGFLGLFPG